MEELREALGNLTSLVTLDLGNCKNLKELPEALGNLTLLVWLDLRGCTDLDESSTLTRRPIHMKIDMCVDQID